ncbi:MAG: hypothetical protein ACW99G_07900 [Candidatus Thorarchaeota archaeon]|jgi:hypothetical protein
MSVKHERDKRGAYEDGLRAEELFAKLCEREGIEVKKSSTDEDIMGRIDYHLWNKGKKLTVDVKAMKSIKAWGKKQDKKIWVELKSKGYPGWLYAGKADLIAFEMKDHFLIVVKQNLREWCDANIDRSVYCMYPDEAELIVYLRPGTNDELSLVDAKEIEKLSTGRLDK